MKTLWRNKVIIIASLMLLGASGRVVAQGPLSDQIDAIPSDASATEVGTEMPAAKAGETKKSKDGIGKLGSVMITMKVPMFNPDFADVPIASVNEEYVTMDELTATIAAMHEGMTEQKTEAKKDYSDILDRLINVRLMIQEGENIGLDQLPQIKSRIENFEKTTLRELLFLERVKDVKVDEKEVERRYRDQIREWKIAPLRFTTKKDAERFRGEIKKGGSFAEMAKKAIEDGKAQGKAESEFMNHQTIQPALTAALEKIKDGSVTPVIPLDSGYAVIQLDETRYVEDPKIREDVSKKLLIEEKRAVLEAYKKSLINKYVKINSKLLKKIDFEAPKPGFKAMLKDKRVIAEIRDEEPITVGDLASSLKERFFHGINIPIREKKLNALKAEQLDIMLQKRVFHKEALALGTDKSDDFLKRLRKYKDQMIFGMFIETVVRKEVKVTDEELRAYYNEHSGDEENIFPAMVRMNGLAFNTLEAAQSTLEKLRQGVDFKWLKSNAEDQVPEGSPGLLGFTENLVVVTTLPENLRNILSGARSGDFRLYSDEAKHYYAIHLMEIIPQRQKSFEEMKDVMTKIVYAENLNKAIDQWSKSLREAAEIKLFVDLTEIQQL